jgi:hypothetical protein
MLSPTAKGACREEVLEIHELVESSTLLTFLLLIIVQVGPVLILTLGRG